MPKDKRLLSLTSNHHRASPYSKSSSGAKQCTGNIPLASTEDVKEWEEVRCPVCMEHPHNAVLLQCASYEKGCRPYMCNTSRRHSNCLDQFSKSSVLSPSATIIRDSPSGSMTSHLRSVEEPLPSGSMSCDGLQQKLVCPLCRGHVHGWIVIEPARQFMNRKRRSCSSEACEFVGTYSELRKHARMEHPSIHPRDVDPGRQYNWMRLENQSDLEDVLSTFQVIDGEESNWMGLEESYYRMELDHLRDDNFCFWNCYDSLDYFSTFITFPRYDLRFFIRTPIMEQSYSFLSMSWDSSIYPQFYGSIWGAMHSAEYGRETNPATRQSNRWRP